MPYKQLLIVLTGAGDKRAAVKINGDLNGKCNVKILLKNLPEQTGGSLYVIGDEIAKIDVKKDKNEYLTPLCAKKDIVCLYSSGIEYLLGGTGKLPSLKSVISRIKDWENLHKQQDEKPAPPQLKIEKNVEAKSQDNNSPNESVSPVENDRPQEKDDSVGATDPMLNLNNQQSPLEEPMKRAEEPAPRTATQTANAASVLNDGIRYDGTNFYLAIKPQLDELFVCYPEEETLNKIVPNSRWVRVDAEDGFYVVGLLYDLSAPSFICYGIPSVFQKKPPSEIADVCVWLPLDLANRDGDGYWVIYQSAVDGKCIR